MITYWFRRWTLNKILIYKLKSMYHTLLFPIQKEKVQFESKEFVQTGNIILKMAAALVQPPPATAARTPTQPKILCTRKPLSVAMTTTRSIPAVRSRTIRSTVISLTLCVVRCWIRIWANVVLALWLNASSVGLAEIVRSGKWATVLLESFCRTRT